MDSIHHNAVTALRKLGLYEPAHQIWMKRTDIRLTLYNSGYRLAGARDRLPVPPTRLIKLVQINGEIASYLRSGAFGTAGIINALIYNGYNIEKFERILDFGCGCGRIMRQWHGVKGPHFYGTDLNADLIHWCQAKLGTQAEFGSNGMLPPLDYPDKYFDFIYSISVFTHLGEQTQVDWMGELLRVLKENGLLLITVHGEWRISELDLDERSRFNSGELIVKYQDEEGSNLCGAYHPQAYVRNHLAKGFEVLYFLPTGAIDVGQDLYLLRRPVSSAV
jgi:SAM-dependent methyltransferase